MSKKELDKHLKVLSEFNDKLKDHDLKKSDSYEWHYGQFEYLTNEIKETKDKFITSKKNKNENNRLLKTLRSKLNKLFKEEHKKGLNEPKSLKKLINLGFTEGDAIDYQKRYSDSFVLKNLKFKCIEFPAYEPFDEDLFHLYFFLNEIIDPKVMEVFLDRQYKPTKRGKDGKDNDGFLIFYLFYYEAYYHDPSDEVEQEIFEMNKRSPSDFALKKAAKFLDIKNEAEVLQHHKEINNIDNNIWQDLLSCIKEGIDNKLFTSFLADLTRGIVENTVNNDIRILLNKLKNRS